MQDICNKNECTACFACVNICPKQCITMVEDGWGDIFPNINTEKCVDCGLCKKVCLNNDEVKYHVVKKTIAAWSADEKERKECASGGVATIASHYVIDNAGVVFGAAVTDGGIVKHIAVTSHEDLFRLSGSKYVISHIGNSYRECKKFLDLGKMVLFIGTPCQIYGLKKFLKTTYEKLLCMDIICHGVPSQRLLISHLKNRIKDNLSDVDIKFRTGNQWYIKVVDRVNNIKYYNRNDLYMYGFFQGDIFRENCYSCKFARQDRVGDITLGDFWNVPLDNYTKEIRKGVSCVLLNTALGEWLFSTIEKKLICREYKLSDALAGNQQLNFPMRKGIHREKIVNMVNSGIHIDDAIRKCYLMPYLLKEIKTLIKRSKEWLLGCEV